MNQLEFIRLLSTSFKSRFVIVFIVIENLKETIKMFAKVPGIWILLCMIQFFILTTNIHQSKMVYGHGHFWSDFFPYKTTRWFGPILGSLHPVGSTPIIHPSIHLAFGTWNGLIATAQRSSCLGGDRRLPKNCTVQGRIMTYPTGRERMENHRLKRAGIEDMFFFPQEGNTVTVLQVSRSCSCQKATKFDLCWPISWW